MYSVLCHCGEVFEAKRRDAVSCSDRCRQRRWREAQRCKVVLDVGPLLATLVELRVVVGGLEAEGHARAVGARSALERLSLFTDRVRLYEFSASAEAPAGPRQPEGVHHELFAPLPAASNE